MKIKVIFNNNSINSRNYFYINPSNKCLRGMNGKYWGKIDNQMYDFYRSIADGEIKGFYVNVKWVK